MPRKPFVLYLLFYSKSEINLDTLKTHGKITDFKKKEKLFNIINEFHVSYIRRKRNIITNFYC